MSDEFNEQDTPLPNGEKGEETPGEETQQIASEASDTEAANEGPAPRKKRGGRWRALLAAIAGLIVFIGLGALGGMQAGISARQEQESLQRAIEAVAQYELAMLDLAAGNCDIARQRFQYVIELNPSYPEAGSRLAEAMLCATAPDDGAPQAEATAQATPTPDLRGAEQLFADAQNLFNTSQWTEVLTTIDTLRLNFPEYMPIEGDRLYYLALLNRGVTYIGQGNLEGGIYDLNRAEQIGPLNYEAHNFRQWAIWYIVGQSFWEVDWVEAAYYFGLLAEQVPNLHDANAFSVSARFATAQVGAHHQSLEQAIYIGGLGGWCEADNLLSQAESYQPIQVSPEVQPTIDWIRFQCRENPGGQAATPTPRP